MRRRPTRITLTDHSFPYTTLFRSVPSRANLPGCELAEPQETPLIGPGSRQSSGSQQSSGREIEWLPAIQNRVDNVGCKITEPSQARQVRPLKRTRSEEHTSELQSLMHISYAVFCLKKKI